jgi:hypothetical protein
MDWCRVIDDGHFSFLFLRSFLGASMRLPMIPRRTLQKQQQHTPLMNEDMISQTSNLSLCSKKLYQVVCDEHTRGFVMALAQALAQ